MSNDILNSLLKEYDQKKLKAEFECDERKNNLYRLIPRLQEIDNELNRLLLMDQFHHHYYL